MKLFTTLVASLFFTCAFAQDVVQGEYLVQLSSDADKDKLVHVLENNSIRTTVRNIFPSLNIFSIIIDPSSAKQEIDLRILLEESFVKIAHPNRKLQNRATEPNDPMYSDQWHLERINAPLAWDLNTGGTNYRGEDVVIAVVDDGFYYEHEDLFDNIWSNKHEIDNDGIDNDGNNYVDDFYGFNVALPDGMDRDAHKVLGHGTRVCGLVGAIGNNNQGVTGINWKTKIMLVSGQTHEASIIEAYNYILDQRRRYNESDGAEGAYVVVANSSFGIDNQFAENFPLWCDVYNKMGEQGILSVVATSNNAVNVEIEGDMPSTCTSDYLIAVTSLDQSNEISRGFGSTSVDLGAPGEGLLSTNTNDGFKEISGNSAATPVVSGAVGLLYSLSCSIFNQESQENPGALALQVKDAILQNVKPIGSLTGNTTTEGMLDLFATHESLKNSVGTSSNIFSICHLSPNPVTSELNLEYTVEGSVPHSISIYSSIGALVYHQEVTQIVDNNVNITLSMQDYAQGVYIVSIQTDDHTTSQKILKK